MMKLLQILLFGHCHKWVEDKRLHLFESQQISSDKRPIGIVVLCHCEKCGLPKRFELS